MALIAEMTSASYAVSIPDEKFEKLMARDWALADENNYHFDEDLMRLGASKIEYNGHYGPYIYFNLTIDEDHDQVKADVLAKIEEYIQLL